MDDVLDAATDLVRRLPLASIEALVGRIRGTSVPARDLGLNSIVKTAESRVTLDRLLASCDHAEIHGNELAGILLGASYASQKADQETTVELVLTGPTTPFVAHRRTEQVLLDLIRRAQNELFLVSFVAYDVASVVSELNAAISRGVKILVLLESSTDHGGSLGVDPAAIVRRHVPSAILYAWTDRAPPFQDGRVHAKVMVADEKIAFLTSANLTGHAMEINMEAGVVIVGGNIPVKLRAHLHALVETNIIHKV